MPIKMTANGPPDDKQRLPRNVDKATATGAAEGVPLRGTQISRLIAAKNRLPSNEDRRAISRFILSPKQRRAAIFRLAKEYPQDFGDANSVLDALLKVLADLPKWLAIIAQIMAMFADESPEAERAAEDVAGPQAESPSEAADVTPAANEATE